MDKLSYKDSGVDKEEGYKTVDKIKSLSKKTYTDSVLSGIGSFAALYELKNYKNPILVSGTDGVGTKLEIAFKLKKYDTVGIDCVAMCVNDILCHGAKPLFFLDYMACGKLDNDEAASLVSGIAEGCILSGCSLIGGETAEMPGFYKQGDYDIAGFTVGVVEKEKIIDGKTVCENDSIIAIASSGVHSNGFSLVRKLLEKNNISLDAPFENKTIGEELLTPTRIYAKSVLKILQKYNIKSMAHITGGGLIENLPRAYTDEYTAIIEKDKIKVLPIFKYIESLGVEESEMYNTFNMGIVFVLIVDKSEKENIINDLIELGEEAYEIGSIQKMAAAEKITIK